MPVPKPSKSENYDKFMSRCMSNSTMQEYDRKQRSAICIRQWGDEPISNVGKKKRGKK